MAVKTALKAVDAAYAPVIATGSASGETTAQYFWRKVEERGDAIALRRKHRGIWKPTTWREFGENAKFAGLGLLSLGVKRGDVVTLLSDGGPEWLFADRGIQAIGAVCNAVHASDDPARVQAILENSATRVAIVENAEQLQKVLGFWDRLPKLQKVVVLDFEGLHGFHDPKVVSFDDLLAAGRELGAKQPQAWEREVAAGTASDTAAVAYSLGGDGGPIRGVLLTHGNLMFMVHNRPALWGQSADDVQLNLLPLANVTERVLTSLIPLHTGAVLNFVESSDTVDENLQEVQPTCLFATPRRLERISSRQAAKMVDATAFGRWAYRTALAVGERAARKRTYHTGGFDLTYWLADLLVLRNVKRFHGLARAKHLLVGGGILSDEIYQWFSSLGLDVNPVYGLAESGGLAAMPAAGSDTQGRVDQSLPGTEMSLAPSGEILLRGPHVSPGYLGEASARGEDDWLRTGDLGEVDAEGSLTVIGRIANRIVLAGGQTVSPERIEARLCASPYIAAAVLVSTGGPTLGALILADHESVAQYAQNLNVPFTNFASLSAAPEVQELIRTEINKVNDASPSDLAIRDFRLLNRAFAPDDVEVAKGIRLNRAAVVHSFAPLVEAMRATRNN